MGKMAKHKILYRSSNKMLGGVCSGIAEYFGIDPNIVRVIWALMVFLWGAGVILYIIAWVMIPLRPC